MGEHWQVVPFLAVILAIIAYGAWRARRRRPVAFQHDGRTYRRRPDGSFLTDAGIPAAGALTIAALAAAYEADRESGHVGGSSSDPGDGDSGGDGGGGGDGGSD